MTQIHRGPSIASLIYSNHGHPHIEQSLGALRMPWEGRPLTAGEKNVGRLQIAMHDAAAAPQSADAPPRDRNAAYDAHFWLAGVGCIVSVMMPLMWGYCRRPSKKENADISDGLS